MLFLAKRAGTVQPSLFFCQSFHCFFLHTAESGVFSKVRVHCHWGRVRQHPGTAGRTGLAAIQQALGVCTDGAERGDGALSFPRLWPWLAGRLSYLMIWRKQCLPTDGAKSPRWAGTVCIFVRSVPVKTALRINQVLSRVVSPPLTAVYAQNKAKIWFILEECTKESNK